MEDQHLLSSESPFRFPARSRPDPRHLRWQIKYHSPNLPTHSPSPVMAARSLKRLTYARLSSNRSRAARTRLVRFRSVHVVMSTESLALSEVKWVETSLTIRCNCKLIARSPNTQSVATRD